MLLDLFHGVLDRAGLERKRFHALWHSATTLLLAQGADIVTVASISGA